MVDGEHILDFLAQVAGRRIVVFGAGPTAREYLMRIPLPVAYLVDNDRELWGQEALEHPVRPPESLREEKAGSFVVVIASNATADIAEQLRALGLTPGRDFVPSPLMLSDEVMPAAAAPRLLVTTLGETGGVWQVDWASGETERVAGIDGDCRGAIKVPGGYLVVLEHEGILRLDESLAILERHPIGRERNLHGLAVDAKQRVLFLNETARDEIAVYDLDSFREVRRYSLAREPGAAMEQHHVNDVAFQDGMLYVSLFSVEGVWRQEIWGDGAILRMDPATGAVDRTLIRGLSQPHSLVYDQGHWYYCNSMECEVRRGDTTLCRLLGYPRGLAKRGPVLFIGQSRIRRMSRFRDKFPIISLDSGVHAWNATTRTTRFVKLPVDGVFDIVVM